MSCSTCATVMKWQTNSGSKLGSAARACKSSTWTTTLMDVHTSDQHWVGCNPQICDLSISGGKWLPLWEHDAVPFLSNPNVTVSLWFHQVLMGVGLLQTSWNYRASSNFPPSNTFTDYVTALLRVVDSILHKELGKQTERSPSLMEQAPEGPAGTREEVGAKKVIHFLFCRWFSLLLMGVEIRTFDVEKKWSSKCHCF